MSRSAKEWSSPQNALAYLNVADNLPHRSEGESVLIDHLPESTKRILDLGTGDGRLIRLIKANRSDIEEAVALDVSPTMLKSAREHFAKDSSVKITEHDLSQPLPDLGYFDAVVSSFSIHHLKHDMERASSGTFAETASFGELNVLATSWDGTAEAIKMANPKNFAGKIVIDVTNPLDFSKGMPPRLAIGHTDSAGETVQRMLSESKVVKAFNIVGNPHFIHPDFPGGPPTMATGDNTVLNNNGQLFDSNASLKSRQYSTSVVW